MNEVQRRPARRSHATIKEVAALAGVSQMTVSRVLNHRETVKDSTRARVEEAVRELNYRPNVLARGLAGGKSLFIGLIYHNPSNSYLGELLVGALKACRDLGHHLVIEDCGSQDVLNHGPALVQRLTGAGLDGVIVAPPISENDEVLDALAAAGIMTVLISPKNVSKTDISVSIDDARAAEEMTELVLGLGHRRIAFIRGPDNQSSSRHRFRGFEAALARKGLPVESRYIAQGDYTYRSGMLAAESLLALPDRPTAFFASNDDMAAGAVSSAQRLGIKVPDDLSVVGFDDTLFATAIWPQLTTVRQPIALMAAQAVGLLSRHAGGHEAAAEADDPAAEIVSNLVLTVEIISRGSLRQL